MWNSRKIGRLLLEKVAEEALLPPNEWGFSNKMLDLTRHIDKVRKA